MNDPTSLTGGIIVSVQVGKPMAMMTADGRQWRSAIVKQPVVGPVRLDGENLVGDYQANRKYHGGPAKAVCLFSNERYPALGSRVGLDLGPGAFGENLTISCMTEDDVCIGDTLGIGDEIRLQVSQPRAPCASIAKRWNAPSLPRVMEETGWTGFYCRILQHGSLQSGDALKVLERPNSGWTIARANSIVYKKPADRELLAALRRVSYLSDEWTGMLDYRLGRDGA